MNKPALVLSTAIALPASAVWAAGPDPFTIAPAPASAYQLGQLYSSLFSSQISLPYVNQPNGAATLFAAVDRQSALFDKVRNGMTFSYALDDYGLPQKDPRGFEPFGANFIEHGRRFLSSAEFEQKMGRAVGIVSVGMLRESGALLGNVQGRAVALNVSPTTTFTSVSAGYALTEGSSLVAMATSGRTAGFGSADSLMSQVSAVRTVAYSVGFSTSRVWRPQDRLGLTFSIPARVTSGDGALSGSVTQVIDGGVLSYSTQTLNLRPTATERNTELTYTTMFGKDGRLGKVTGAVMWRINPGHDATAPSDWLIGVRYGRNF